MVCIGIFCIQFQLCFFPIFFTLSDVIGVIFLCITQLCIKINLKKSNKSILSIVITRTVVVAAAAAVVVAAAVAAAAAKIAVVVHLPFGVSVHRLQ